jgi:hypothetical protein
LQRMPIIGSFLDLPGISKVSSRDGGCLLMLILRLLRRFLGAKIPFSFLPSVVTII